MKPRPVDRIVDELPVDAIRVGKRYRQHMGDIPALAASIKEHGLLHAIVVTPERDLVAGERRLLAVRLLGWTTVPVRVVTPADLLRAEADENRVRADFAPSEAVAIAKALAPVVATPHGGNRASAQVSHLLPGRTSDKVASAVGLSGRTLEKAMAVVDAADADPELGDLVAQMDDTGKVDGAYRELVRRTAPPSGDPLPMTDVHRAKFPELAYTELRSELTTDMHAFAKATAWRPETWADRMDQFRPAEIAAIRQQITWVRLRLDAWDALLDRPALSLVGEPR